jgi:hypothetical protein
MQKVCSVSCSIKHAEQTKERQKGREAAAERAQTREKLKAMEKYPKLVQRTQAAFNGFIRQRDLGMPCISCGRQLSTEPNSHDAGHFRSVGSAPHMRFVEDNCHSQCRHCNHRLGGNHVEYRKGLINRIGIKAVELIENDNTLRKYTREALEEIAKHYRAEARKLLKEKE